MNKKSKIANIITIVIFVGILATLSFLFLLKKDKSFSEQENRNLQIFPEFNSETFFDGRYSKKINTYFADQFPFRDSFVGIKGMSELSMLKGENNGVLLGKDGYLAVRSFSVLDDTAKLTEPTDYYSKKVLDAHFKGVLKLQNNLEKQGIEFAIVIPPRTIDVAASKFDLPDTNSKELQSYIRDGLKVANYIDIYSLLKEKLENDEYVYYKTDHHYTSLGAYYTYCEIMKQYGMEKDIIPLSDFDVKLASNKFYGTTWSKAGFKFAEPDSIHYFDYKYSDEESEYITNKGDVSFGGFYDFSLLNTKDKYSFFLGGNSKLTTITKTSGENSISRPKMLLAKDSFGLSLAPFLALHFDLEIVNVADYSRSLSSLAVEKECSHVLVVYNTENLISTKYLAAVK